MRYNRPLLLIRLVILLSLTGCYSVKEIPGTNQSELVGKPMIVHSSDTSLRVDYAGSSQEYITGTIISGIVNLKEKQFIHLYLAPDYKISKKGEQITIPFSSIKRIEKYKINGFRTTVFVSATAFLTAIAIGFLSIVLGGGYGM